MVASLARHVDRSLNCSEARKTLREPGRPAKEPSRCAHAWTTRCAAEHNRGRLSLVDASPSNAGSCWDGLAAHPTLVSSTRILGRPSSVDRGLQFRHPEWLDQILSDQRIDSQFALFVRRHHDDSDR